MDDKELWIPYIYLLLVLKKLIEDRGAAMREGLHGTGLLVLDAEL